MQTVFTFIDNIPIICDEKLYINEKYNLHLNQQLYAYITPYIIELYNINIHIILSLNNIYTLKLKKLFHIYQDSTNM